MAVRPLAVVHVGLIIMAGAVIVECVALVLLMLKISSPASGPFAKLAFALGCAMLTTGAVGVLYLRYGVDGFGYSSAALPAGPDPITQLFSLLAIETGTLGYFTFQSAWRRVPLAFIIIGVLCLLRPFFQR